MTEEKKHKIGDQEIRDGDLTPVQHHHKNHVISLRNKIAKLQFEIDDLTPSLNFYENALLETTKKESEEERNNQEELNKQAEQAAAEEQ
tara:strand:- start:112 stop:378 length:267 start_codon:yes stop_codon:yes gene_type:complete